MQLNAPVLTRVEFSVERLQAISLLFSRKAGVYQSVEIWIPDVSAKKAAFKNNIDDTVLCTTRIHPAGPRPQERHS